MALELVIHISEEADDRDVGGRSYVYRAVKSIWMHIPLDRQSTYGAPVRRYVQQPLRKRSISLTIERKAGAASNAA